MTTRWKWTPFNDQELENGRQLATALHIHPVVGSILTRRGVTTEQEARKFFRPSLKDLHNPLLMRDMPLAVARINKALGAKEKIMVYGDYDVDGTTAVALVYKGLRQTGCSEALLSYFIPDRYEDGYGVSFQSIDRAYEQGVKLIIVLDCGIKAIQEVAYAKEKGIDFIICDHHTPADILPNAVAVLNPKRADNSYPFTELSGCGIGFKLLQALAIDNGIPLSSLNNLLELCAISIAADLVSVMGENRILAYHGLKQLNKKPSPGIRGILATCGLTYSDIDMSDIVFKIGPLLNASGRMMSGSHTVDLLLSNSREEADEKCRAIIQYNEERKILDKDTTEEAFSMINECHLAEENKIIILYRAQWHKGVIGIVSSRIAEHYARPVIILGGEGDSVSGSSRSIGGFDMYKALDLHSHLLKDFGGHPYAAGLTLSQDLIPRFIEEITSYANKQNNETSCSPVLNIDAEVALSQLSNRLLKSIRQLAPFGPENVNPIFLTRHLYDNGGTRIVGKNKRHLKLEVTDAINRRYHLSAIAFGLASHYAHIKTQQPFSICYTLEQNNYHGSNSLQMQVKDIKPDPAAERTLE